MSTKRVQQQGPSGSRKRKLEISSSNYEPLINLHPLQSTQLFVQKRMNEINDTIHPMVEYLKNIFPCDYETDFHVLTNMQMNKKNIGDNTTIFYFEEKAAVAAKYIEKIPQKGLQRNSVVYKLRYNDDDDKYLDLHTDIVDYLILNGFQNISKTLNNPPANVEDLPELIRHCICMSDGQDVERHGPMGIVTFLEKSSSLNFGKLLTISLIIINEDDQDMKNVLDKIWKDIEYTQSKILQYLPKQRIKQLEKTIHFFKEGLNARKQLFVSKDLSLYERAVVLANTWLTVYNFVYFAVSRVNESMDAYGYSIKKLLYLHNNTDIETHFSLPENEYSFIEYEKIINGKHPRYIDVRMQIDIFDSLLNEILLKEYKMLNLVSPHDKRLNICNSICNDLNLCYYSEFEKLDQRLKRRRDVLDTKIKTTTPPSPLDYHQFPKVIDKEIRIGDLDEFCIYPKDNASIIYIYQKAIATMTIDDPLQIGNQVKPTSVNFMDILGDEIWNEFERDEKDDDDFENSDIFEEEEDIDDYFNAGEDIYDNYDYDAYYEYFSPKLEENKTFRFMFLGMLSTWENLGPLLNEDEKIQYGMSESIREAMAIEEISHNIENLNRYEVRFSLSRYILSQGKIISDYPNTYACKLNRIDSGSEVGIHSIYRAGIVPTSKTKKYRPHPYDIMFSIMFHLSMGNKNIDLNSNFWMRQRFIVITAAKKRAKYARVMTISPIRLTKLEIDETTTICIEDILDKLFVIYNDYVSRLHFEHALMLVCQLEEEDKNGQVKFNRLIEQIKAVDLSSYQLSRDLFPLIVSNMLIAMSFMKSTIKNVYANRYMECNFL